MFRIVLMILLIVLIIILAASEVGQYALVAICSMIPATTTRLYVDELDVKKGGRGATTRNHKRGRRGVDDVDANKNTVIYKDLTQHPRSRSEAAVITELESITGAAFPTAYPPWLTWRGSRLELDGYNEQLHVALEFSGPLHTKWTPTVEPYEHYYRRIVRDVVKRRVCANRGIHLIIVDMRLPRGQQRNYLLSRLYDIGIISDRPTNYHIAQEAPVFRNTSLEKELGLGAEMTEAENS
jgi:hypothetical protein